MENNLILETRRIKEIMGVSLSENIISPPKDWLKKFISKFGSEAKIVQDFNVSTAFKNFDELRGFLTSPRGMQFLDDLERKIATLPQTEKTAANRLIDDLRLQAKKPIFTKEWQQVKSDIKINNLFTKNPNAEQSIKNWLESQVAAGQSVNSIGMSKIENMIKKIPGGTKNRFQVIDFANKYVSSGGAKIALGVMIGGAVLGFWDLVDVLKWLKGVVYTPDTPTPDTPTPDTPTPDTPTPETTPETITTEAQLRAKYPCVNGEAGVRFSPITNNKCTVIFSNGESYELTINGDKVTYSQDGSEIC